MTNPMCGYVCCVCFFFLGENAILHSSSARIAEPFCGFYDIYRMRVYGFCKRFCRTINIYILYIYIYDGIWAEFTYVYFVWCVHFIRAMEAKRKMNGHQSTASNVRCARGFGRGDGGGGGDCATWMVLVLNNAWIRGVQNTILSCSIMFCLFAGNGGKRLMMRP